MVDLSYEREGAGEVGQAQNMGWGGKHEKTSGGLCPVRGRNITAVPRRRALH